MNDHRRVALCLAFLMALVPSPASASITITCDTDWTVRVGGQHFGYQIVRYTSPLSTPDAPRFTRYHVLVCGPLILNLDQAPHRRVLWCGLFWVLISILCKGMSRPESGDESH